MLFILPSLNVGGTENYVLRFISHYTEEITFDIMSLTTTKGDLHDQYMQYARSIIYQKIGYFNLILWWKLFRLAQVNKYHTVAVFNGDFAGIPLWLSRLASVSQRVALYRRSSHAFNDKNILKRYYATFTRSLVRRHSTKILSNGRAALDYFHGERWKKNDKFRVISNGIDSKLILGCISKYEARAKFGIDSSKFVIGHIGRFNQAKNHITIFKVAKHLLREFANLHIVFCGANTDSVEFNSQLIKYGINESCTSLGMQREIGDILNSFDLFFFPSLTEGQPNALIEAMVAGLPFVASDISSIKECVPIKKHGQLIDPLDVLEYVKIISTCINKKEILENMSCAREARMKFDGVTNFELFKQQLIK